MIILKLFSYSTTMSGVISPTNLSLYSTPITTAPRTAPRSRWNPPFLLEEDFNMIAQHPSPLPNQTPSEANSVILMEEGK